MSISGLSASHRKPVAVAVHEHPAFANDRLEKTIAAAGIESNEVDRTPVPAREPIALPVCTVLVVVR